MQRRQSYRQVRWVPTSVAQLRLKETAVASDCTQERPGHAPAGAPAHLPRLQRCRRETNQRDAASDHRGH